MAGGRAGQAHPGGFALASAGEGRQAEIEHDQREAGFENHLGGGQSPPQVARAEPQETLEADPGSTGPVRIQVVPQIDEGRRLAATGRGGEGGENTGEAAARGGSHELHQTSQGQAAGQEAVEGLEPAAPARRCRGVSLLPQQIPPGLERAGELVSKPWNEGGAAHGAILA